MFAAATATSDHVRYRIAHKDRTLAATGPQQYVTPGTWLTAFYLAVVCRERDRITALCRVPLSLLRENRSHFALAPLRECRRNRQLRMMPAQGEDQGLTGPGAPLTTVRLAVVCREPEYWSEDGRPPEARASSCSRRSPWPAFTHAADQGNTSGMQVVIRTPDGVLRPP
ncbi:Imm49 family immunity protein [Streptomyces sp. NPDC046161]|uniref:Imm49 family immunity protein n=1 Tax=Streptomyces sp. NPDC046161 TaxID=3155132 RepID=UPI0033EC120D